MIGRQHGPRCECLACFGRRLAIGYLLVGLAAVLLLAALAHAGEPTPMLIDGTAQQ